MKCLLAVLCMVLAGCVGIPDTVEPVKNFKLQRYLGTWYEIARLDHSFERGLSRVTAEYSLRDDGGVKVINRGYDAAEKKWSEADGKAYFVDDEDTGYLKVSFFGPFYGAYVVFELDEADYQYALVAGPDTSYLWILARTPTLDPVIQRALIDKARARGFDTDKLIQVDHSAVP